MIYRSQGHRNNLCVILN